MKRILRPNPVKNGILNDFGAVSYLSQGDRLDLQTHVATPGPDKGEEFRIDTSAPGYQPYYTQPQFYTDIFANTALRDVMAELIDSKYAEAIGIGFDGAAAREGATPGFEFRFSRDGRTRGWDSPVAAGDSTTVIDVRLDIRPLAIHGPLYQ